jgi:cytochrome c-type biogenesis protein CcmH/NrfG
MIWGSKLEPTGEGMEVSQAEDIWQNEKVRLLDLVRENDIALVENRISTDQHEEIALQLSEEAEVVVDRLRQLRSYTVDNEDVVTTTTAIPLSIGSLMVVGVTAFAVTLTANVNNIDLSVSPHMTGQIPLDKNSQAMSSPSGMPPMTADDETPDIEAMVARLEERVYSETPTEKDIRMLLRSYRVLERGEDAIYVLGLASDQFPDNVEFKMMFLRGSLQQPDFESSEELTAVVEDVIRLQPNLYEAHWYRGLLLAKQGRVDDARETLTWLRPRIVELPEAIRAVDSLLAELSTQNTFPLGAK